MKFPIQEWMKSLDEIDLDCVRQYEDFLGRPLRDRNEYKEIDSLVDSMILDYGSAVEFFKDHPELAKYCTSKDIGSNEDLEESEFSVDEVFAGETIWICVYKDTLGFEDDFDNLTYICVPTNWLVAHLAKYDNDPDKWFANPQDWYCEYTADDTIDLACAAIADRVILDCSDESIRDSLLNNVNKDTENWTIACNGVPIFDGHGNTLTQKDAEKLEKMWEDTENHVRNHTSLSDDATTGNQATESKRESLEHQIASASSRAKDAQSSNGVAPCKQSPERDPL